MNKALMTALLFVSAVSFSSVSAKADVSCKDVAAKAATNDLNKTVEKEARDVNGNPRKLGPTELATVINISNVDEQDNASLNETGIYVIQMGVMEECVTASKVTTDKSNCSIKEIKQLPMNCG